MHNNDNDDVNDNDNDNDNNYNNGNNNNSVNDNDNNRRIFTQDNPSVQSTVPVKIYKMRYTLRQTYSKLKTVNNTI